MKYSGFLHKTDFASTSCEVEWADDRDVEWGGTCSRPPGDEQPAAAFYYVLLPGIHTFIQPVLG